MGAAAGMSVGTFASDVLGFDLPEAWAGTPLGADQGVLVIINFLGGIDGLNTVVPYTNGLYYSQRPGVAIAQDSVLPLDGTFGLHPNLGYVQQLWQAGQVAVVHGVGNPEADLSHFTAMASWFAGRYGGGATSTGWVGRWLDGLAGDTGDSAALAVGTGVSLQLQGATRRGVAVPPNGSLFGAAQQPADLRMYAGLRAMAQPAGRGYWHEQHGRVLAKQLDLAADVAPVLQPAATGSELVQKLTVAARLINADLGFRVIDISLGGFDTHDNQAGKLAGLLQQFNDGLQAFFATLSSAFRGRVTLLTLSEFGRTGFSNGSAGTDHGTSNVMMVIGANVLGGHYGAPSSLAVANRWSRMVPTTDYRHVLGTCLDRWLGGDATTVLRGAYTDLGCFRRGPGEAAAQPPIVLPPGAGCEFVPMTPVRLFDTRNGTGERWVPLGPGEVWSLPVRGQVGVPNDAVAVIVNLTGTEMATPTYVTAWPAGSDRPTTSNLNLVPGPATANLTSVRLSSDGRMSLFNFAGSTHLVGDISGYFRAGTSQGMVPLVPSRLLDTRDGTGGVLGAVGGGGVIDCLVAGQGGVPGTATAALLNVTITEATAESFVAVWPSGVARPTSSSVNFGRGDTRPNLVVCPIGAGGKVSIYQHVGSAHVVVDVLGAVVPGATGAFVPVNPDRVLDTRVGNGAPTARVGQTPLTLGLLGRGGVPASGVTAVLLNLTGVEPDSSTFVTVYPTGTDRPTASNLNLPVGGVRPNAVFARMGSGGSVQIYNHSGTIDLVADVLGYVTA
jgi:uncharacterized protein (DUF1501 family)